MGENNEEKQKQNATGWRNVFQLKLEGDKTHKGQLAACDVTHLHCVCRHTREKWTVIWKKFTKVKKLSYLVYMQIWAASVLFHELKSSFIFLFHVSSRTTALW